MADMLKYMEISEVIGLPPVIIHLYPLVNIQKTMENHHFVAGKIHYFYGPFSIAMLGYITRLGKSHENHHFLG